MLRTTTTKGMAMEVFGTEFDEREASIAILSISVLTPVMAKEIARGDRALEAEITSLIYKARSVVYRKKN